MDNCREVILEEKRTVSQTSEEDRMTKEDQDFSEADDGEQGINQTL